MRADPALVLEVTTAQRTAVEAALRRRELAPRVRERLEMVKAAALGQEHDEIARWTGRTPETVRRWLAVFQEGGIGALADAPRRGRPPKADAAYLAALEAVVDTAPRLLGLPFDVWTSGRLSAYLTQQTGVRIAPGWLRVCCCSGSASSVAGLNTPSIISKTRPKWPPVQRRYGWRGGKGTADAGAVRTAL